ncbi:hypothetical protein F442_01686 [Phytophthora nicotianae P10297]|uniref:Uncharacterized protein n=3 Tax=Phytophthora nicotianae TaxID=4792 RepID=V9FXS3_PHYNI|nr:hypothetical protein F443_01742 [Phytophthora nicotianae P1569]ETM55082.1 hypothetical protein L914_01650 [Phytophthora nicotianae]ETP53401.1 hypothetical protein F442_01686 [Phytophthora nicotianae P10297]
MPRYRVGVEELEKSEEPHDEVSPSRQKASVSTPAEAAKAQRQKELLRKKKVERRARAAEKQQRKDEKKQKRELEKMMEEDVPAVDRVESLCVAEPEEVRTLEASTKSLNEAEDIMSENLIVRPLEDSTNSTTIEMLPKKLKEPSHDSAALTIQKALKKKFKKCKTMFRQSPRVFAEEVVNPPLEEVEPPSTLATDTELGPPIEIITTALPLPQPEVVIPPLDLPQLKPSTSPRASSSSRSIVFLVLFLLMLLFLQF